MKKRKISISPKLRTHKQAVPETRHIFQVGRNDPCPCGSGRKYKECHEAQGEGFLKKLARQEKQARLREQGVSWWKRWLFFYK